MRATRWLLQTLVAVIFMAACGSSNGDDPNSNGAGQPSSEARPSIVVTTSVLGDVVSSLVGDAAVVTTIMPRGVSPHDFQASAQQAEAMRQADLLVTNGADLEQGLHSVIEAAKADGIAVYEAISAVQTIEFGGDDSHSETDAHGHSTVDPHFFTDPRRMVEATQGLVDELAQQTTEINDTQVKAAASSYIDKLEALDAEVEQILSVVPTDRRVLITNHDVFGYFADRYDFTVLASVIPGGTTSEGASAQDLARLVKLIKDRRVPAIFADVSSPTQLSDTLAQEVGDVAVIKLFSESLGQPGSGGATYLEMVRTNAERIAKALGTAP